MSYQEPIARRCQTARCNLPVYCYCQDDRMLLCRSHVGSHYYNNHEVLPHKCEPCGGHGRVHAQYAGTGGSWVRCAKCDGVGYVAARSRTRSQSSGSQGSRQYWQGADHGGRKEEGSRREESRSRTEDVDASVDHYSVLGVPSTADAETIRKAYRKLIRQYHPDLNPGSQYALERTKNLNRAYDVLSNATLRREYDAARRESQSQGSGTESDQRSWRQGQSYEDWRAEDVRRRRERWRYNNPPPNQEATQTSEEGHGCRTTLSIAATIFVILMGIGVVQSILSGDEAAPEPVSTPPSRTTESPSSSRTQSPASTATPVPDLKIVGDRLLVAGRIERWIFLFTNEERQKAGLHEFMADGRISRIAEAHSRNMARVNVFDHVVDGKDANDRALDNGYDCRAYFDDGTYTYGLGENIYKYPRVRQWTETSFGFGLVTTHEASIYVGDEMEMGHELVKGWMESPGHRENILDSDYRRIGVGVFVETLESYGYVDEIVYATQNFSSCE